MSDPLCTMQYVLGMDCGHGKVVHVAWHASIETMSCTVDRHEEVHHFADLAFVNMM